MEKTSTSFLYLIVLACLVMAGVFFFARSSLFAVQAIDIEGLENIPREEMVALLGAVQGENLFLVDTSALGHKVTLHPLVERAAFERRLPHTLVLKIVERRPVALILDRDQVIEVDKTGTILRYQEAWPDLDCPIITGIAIPDTSGPGQVLQDPGLHRALTCLAAAPAELLPQIDEVHVAELGFTTLYLKSSIEVRLGFNENYAGNLKLLNELIKSDEYVKVASSVRYIDLTSGKPVLGL